MTAFYKNKTKDANDLVCLSGKRKKSREMTLSHLSDRHVQHVRELESVNKKSRSHKVIGSSCMLLHIISIWFSHPISPFFVTALFCSINSKGCNYFCMFV